MEQDGPAAHNVEIPLHASVQFISLEDEEWGEALSASDRNLISAVVEFDTERALPGDLGVVWQTPQPPVPPAPGCGGEALPSAAAAEEGFGLEFGGASEVYNSLTAGNYVALDGADAPSASDQDSASGPDQLRHSQAVEAKPLHNQNIYFASPPPQFYDVAGSHLGSSRQQFTQEAVALPGAARPPNVDLARAAFAAGSPLNAAYRPGGIPLHYAGVLAGPQSALSQHQLMELQARAQHGSTPLQLHYKVLNQDDFPVSPQVISVHKGIPHSQIQPTAVQGVQSLQQAPLLCSSGQDVVLSSAYNSLSSINTKPATAQDEQALPDGRSADKFGNRDDTGRQPSSLDIQSIRSPDPTETTESLPSCQTVSATASLQQTTPSVLAEAARTIPQVADNYQPGQLPPPRPPVLSTTAALPAPPLQRDLSRVGLPPHPYQGPAPPLHDQSGQAQPRYIQFGSAQQIRPAQPSHVQHIAPGRIQPRAVLQHSLQQTGHSNSIAVPTQDESQGDKGRQEGLRRAVVQQAGQQRSMQSKGVQQGAVQQLPMQPSAVPVQVVQRNTVAHSVPVSGQQPPLEALGASQQHIHINNFTANLTYHSTGTLFKPYIT